MKRLLRNSADHVRRIGHHARTLHTHITRRKFRSSASSRFLVGVLMVIVIGLGVMLFGGSANVSNISTGGSRDERAMNRENSAGPTPVAPATLNQEERELFSLMVEKDATPEKQERLFTLGRRLSKGVDTVRFFSSCAPDPFVIRKNSDETFTVANAGSDPITVTFRAVDTDETATISPGKSASFVAGFGKGTGFFGYSCSSVSGDTGLGLLVVE